MDRDPPSKSTRSLALREARDEPADSCRHQVREAEYDQRHPNNWQIVQPVAHDAGGTGRDGDGITQTVGGGDGADRGGAGAVRRAAPVGGP